MFSVIPRLDGFGLMPESPAVTARRRRHERELERVGIGTPEGQALLDKWHREDLDSRRVTRKLSPDTPTVPPVVSPAYGQD